MHCNRLYRMYGFLTGKSPNLNKWIIHLPAGAWCSSVEDCYSRSVVAYTLVFMCMSYIYFYTQKDLSSKPIQ